MRRHRLRNLAIAQLPPWTHPPLRSLEKLALAAAGNVLRHLPARPSPRMPPRHVALTLRDYALAQPGTASFRELYPESIDVRTPPPKILTRELHPAFASELSRKLPSRGVGIIRKGRVITAMGAVITPDHCLVHDVSDSGAGSDPYAHPLFSTLRLPDVTHVPGRVAVLTMYQANLPGRPYYSHWLWDVLPRLHLLEKSGVSWDRFVVPQVTRYQRESLALLGIKPESIIAAPDMNIEADELVVPSLPAFPLGNTSPWASVWLRERFLPLTPPLSRSQPRRIYISRAKSGRRRVLNEDELLNVLAPLGFERVFLEDHSFLDGVRLLRDAEAVVTPHGSNVPNIVFCRPGTPVIELFSPKFVVACHYTVACKVGLNYGYLLGKGSVTSSSSNIADMTIDPAQVVSMLRQMMNKP
jgi:capsular polysaccharide biosynthesis protein